MSPDNNKTLSRFEFNPSNYNILILDDSKSINQFLTKSFEEKGYNCISVFTIKDAKEALENNEIHYVMLDINLPDGNGYELITSLEKSSVKIFVLTTESDTEFREVSYQKGILDFILKDKNFFYKVDQITKTIENIEKNRTNTILIIDDSVIIQEQLKELLKNRYYRVQVAANLDKAEQILSETPIDLILLDLVLKEENGMDFLRKNKNEIINIKKIPVLVVSGFVNPSIIRDSIKEGAADVLTKPYVLEEIVLKVDFWTDYKRKENEIINNSKNLELQKVIIEDQNKKLKNQIELEQQINQQKQELLVQQSKMATMGEMLENIIHQWKQPLSAISSSVSSVQLQKEIDILDNETLDDSLIDIMHVIGHLANTLDDFRNYLKPNRKKVVFDLDKNIDQSISLLASHFKSESINIIKEPSNKKAKGFKNDFIQSFLNLLNNSKDALVETSEQKKLIFIDIEAIDDGQIRIKVKDNAGGIPEDIIDRIFESRFTTKTQAGGTGIGLYMTKEMIENHMNGKLEVENVAYIYDELAYKGAEFTIHLPIK